jgi:hypothetical protein
MTMLETIIQKDGFNAAPLQIPSVSFSQNEILHSILHLNNLVTFDADLTYGNGGFYKSIPMPKHRFDIDESLENCINASSTNTPLADKSIMSCIFDPPFLTYVKAARQHNSIMSKRFGGYWRYDELQEHYTQTIKEAHRILAHKGVFVIKCQDIIHNHKMHPTHINVVNWADPMFRLKDLFVLSAKSRMPMPVKVGEAKRRQKHARIFHSYFLVFERNK